MGGSWPKKHYLQHVYTSQLGDIMGSSDFWTIFESFGNSAVVPSANSDRIFSIENDNKQLMLVVKQEIPRIGNHPHFCWDPLDLRPAKGGWRKKTTNNISLHSYQMLSFWIEPPGLMKNLSHRKTLGHLVFVGDFPPSKTHQNWQIP